MASSLQVIKHASELLTGAGLRAKQGRRPDESDLGRVVDGALVLAGKGLKTRVIWTGKTSDLPRRYLRQRATNLRGHHAVMPAMTDCHTHLVFAGDRSNEFSARCTGATYQEIAAAGGGILKTVRATRAASEQILTELAVQRAQEIAAYGVGTIEVKSGYGLTPESEIKSLRAVRALEKQCPSLKFQATFLGAHAFPPEWSREDYLRLLIDRMLPEVAQKRLAHACDVFVDEGYFSVEAGRQLLTRAKKLGFKVKVHADELVCTDATVMACEVGALSADHLLKVSERGIQALAKGSTVGVLLPGTAHTLKTAQAPARALIEAGARIALATDFNPGTCYSLSLPFMMNLAALQLGMTRAEIFAAVTYNAAAALGLEEEQGTLEAGRAGRAWVLPFESFDDLYYRLAWAPTFRRPS